MREAITSKLTSIAIMVKVNVGVAWDKLQVEHTTGDVLFSIGGTGIIKSSCR
jgi:hypothetical protein